MKRISVLTFVFIFLLCPLSICSADPPLELKVHSWFIFNSNDGKTVYWQVSTDPVVDFDRDLTPDEYYWKIYNILRDKRYGFDVSKSVALNKAQEYASHYNKDGDASTRKTVQYWVGFYNDKNKIVFAKVSADLKNYRYRVIKYYLFEKGTEKLLEENDQQSNWAALESNYVVKDSLNYLISNNLGIFKILVQDKLQ